MAPPVDTTSSAVASEIPVKKVIKASGPALRKRKSLDASMASDASRSLDSTLGGAEPIEKIFLWGCELSRKNDTFVAKYPVDDTTDLEHEELHQLVLKGATLGEDAKENDRNVVEVRFEKASGEEQRLTVTSLTLGVAETCRLDLTMTWSKDHDLTFKLIKGSGPVTLLGNHIMTPTMEEDSLFVPDDEEMATTEDEAEESGMATDGDEVDASEVKDLEADKETPATK